MDYTKTLCESIEVIAESVLKGISYDKTITCTIVDDSKKEQGEYIVTDGSVQFTAYTSDTSFYKGTMVYVTIPEGDYGNTKIIVSKKINNSSIEPFIYTAPFDNFLEVSENLYENQSTTNGLVANGSLPYILLCEKNFDPAYSGFTRFAIRADFKSWLKEMNCVSGDYGLKLEVSFKAPAVVGQKDTDTITKILYLNTSDMIGDPYAFDSFFTQEKVFDISAFGGITGIKIYFYQDGNFRNNNEQLIPSTYEDGDEGSNELLSNLFVQDIFIYVGYDITLYDTDFIQLYSFDNPTFSDSLQPKDQEKTVLLKWVHIAEDGTRMDMSDYQEEDFEIRWYKYKLGSPSVDAYSGVHWESVNQNINKKLFSYNFQPDPYKKESEQIKAIAIYQDKVYVSNILVFSNDKQVVNDATVDAIKALTLVCKDLKNGLRYETYGNYFIYDFSNNLIDRGQMSIDRLIECHFKLQSATEEETFTNLTDTDQIIWQIPIKNTMIVYDNIPEDQKDNDYIIITWDKTAIEENLKSNFGPHIKYKIRGYYSPSYFNNTISCTVVKNGITYTASKELSFGQAGTTGTDYTFVLDFDNNLTAITAGNVGAEYGITARLYDTKNEEIDISKNTIEWKWFKSTSQNLVINNSTTTNNRNKISTVGTAGENVLNINDIFILQATLIDWGDYKLTAYLPIPIRSSNEYLFLTGATQIVYLTDGSPLYYNNGYKLFKNGAVEVNNLIWDEYINPKELPDNTEEKNNILRYMPNIKERINDNEYCLYPVSMYVDDLPAVAAQASLDGNVIWTQPILIIQNRYPNANVNSWDGKKLQIGDNFILGKMLGAGKKNNNNTFNGVLLGELSGDSNALTGTTGIYGFDKGEMCYSFTDNGKATIGKATLGQIVFDTSSNHSYIQSKGYSEENKTGMRIDLLNNSIDAKYNDKTIFNLTGIFNPNSTNNTYLTIKSGDNNNTNLLHIGDQSYLQSINYNSENGTGLKIDLTNNSITSKNNGNTIFQLNGNNDSPLMIQGKTQTLMSVGSNSYYLQSDNYTGGEDSKGMHIDLSSGSLYANNATIKGTITADTLYAKNGTIAGWNIGDTGLIGQDGNFSLDTNGNKIYLGTDNFIYLKNAGQNETENGIGIVGANAASIKAPKIWFGDAGNSNSITMENGVITFKGETKGIYATLA